jgi:hypothetical protein
MEKQKPKLKTILRDFIIGAARYDVVTGYA